MQPATPSTNSVIHADGRCPMPVDSSQGVAIPMAKESLCCLIVLPSVLPPGGRIKDFSVQWIVGNDSGSAGNDHTPPPGSTSTPSPEPPGQQIRPPPCGPPRPRDPPAPAQQARVFLRSRVH